MKIARCTLVEIILIIWQITNTGILTAQRHAKPSNIYIEWGNEQKAANMMYSILRSTELLELNYIECSGYIVADSSGICDQNLHDSLIVVENLWSKYIALRNTRMLPDSDTAIMKTKYSYSLSLTGKRLPTVKEAEEIYREYQTLIELLNAYIKKYDYQLSLLWAKQLEKINTLAISAINH